VDDVKTRLRAALEQAYRRHTEFLPRQKAAFEYTFRTEPHTTAAERGADAIAKFLIERCTADGKPGGREGIIDEGRYR
jgi:hypothetical protein